MLETKGKFCGRVHSTGEIVEILDQRKVIYNSKTTWDDETETFGAKRYCVTKDGRQVRVKNEKYVDVENLQGEWEIEDGENGWQPLDVSQTPF